MKREDFFHAQEEVRSEPYRYRACGLEGIYLMNGFTVEEHDGEQHVAVRDVDGLHSAIGRHLVQHRKVLSPREIRFLRNTMGLTQADLAGRIGTTSQSVARWEKGSHEMPGGADKSLRGIFLAYTLGADELETLREFLKSDELDQNDEVNTRPAKFCLDHVWTEKECVAA